MCGIAGVVDLVNQRPIPADAIPAMAQALFHRGPDEDGFLEQSGLALASRRLSIVGLMDGRQPITNEDGEVAVVFNGELFDYPEKKAALESRGHHFRTHCDTELLPHLWEDHGEGMFEHLRGQFAFALWDERKRWLILARDRIGICPLYWTRQGDWLLFGSEVKALLASGMVEARPDRRGINHVFTFFALPGPVTCFEGVQYLLPGHYLRIQFGRPVEPARISEHTYWEIDFPDRGQEERGGDPRQVVDEFEGLLTQAVERRLRADVPVVSYLSGGVDSSVVVALARRVRGHAIPTFTIRIKSPRFDESEPATLVARHLGADPVVVGFGGDDVIETYPALIRAAEGPVIDTACAALLALAREVHARGYKVALTGEGSDEFLAGYPWFKIHKFVNFLDAIPGLPLSGLVRRAFLKLSGAPQFPWELAKRIQEASGGHSAWLDAYGLMSMSKLRLYSKPMLDFALEHVPYSDLNLNLERARRWHPLNQSLYLGIRVMLPGLLLNAKGDRVAMNSSVETRYPFLDEDVLAFLCRIDPRWKMRGFRDKYVLRRLAERWLPRRIAWRRKAMFRAPFDSFHGDQLPPFVDQLLSDESLRKTGYFDPESVRFWRKSFRAMRSLSYQRMALEMGLVGVVATQLWHHTFIDPSLAELPGFAPAAGATGAAPVKRFGIESAKSL
jgi:asparagine synthase (glutamine-hydrolysing)